MLDRVFDIVLPGALRRWIARKGGLGLGLAIVRNLVEMHGGRVAARSDGLGRGSEFSCELPVAGERGDRAAAGERRAGAASRAPTGAGARVLVVDDNADAADALAELLTDLGFRTRAAYDAVGGAETRAGKFKPDVCLLGHRLAGHGRLRAGAARCARADGSDVRIIAVTGYGQDADRRRAREAGFDAHLVKPVSVEALEGALVVPPGS